MTPPRWADWLLEAFCAPHLLEEIQGDLYERYGRDVVRVGVAGANRRFMANVLKFIRPFALKRRHRADAHSSPSFLHPVMIRNYFKTALRNLIRHKVSALINLLGLSLGVTACLVIYLITNFELSYDTFHPDRERIYRLVGTEKFNPRADARPAGFVPNAVPAAIRREVAGLGTVAAFHNIESEVLIPNGSEKPKRFEHRNHSVDPAEIIITDPQYFDLFKYQWLAGDPNTALREPFQLVLSEQKARKYFGNLPLEQLLGKQVIYWDSVRVNVAGIVKEWDKPTDFTFTDFISMATVRTSLLKKSIDLDQWEDIWSSSQAFVKLPEGAKPEQFNGAFRQFSRKHFQGEFKFWPGLQPLSDLHFNADYVDNYSRKAHLPTLYGMMGVAVFILLIAAINFINLSTAQSVQRAKEVGVRKVLGSSRKSLIFQFLSETALLTLVAVGIAMVLVDPILSVFQSLTPNGLTFDLFSLPTLLFLGLVAVMTALLAGFYPSLVLSSYRPALTLKGQSALVGGQRGYLRKGLIIFQFTVSLVFIIGTLMVERQLGYIRNKDLGFSTAAIIEVKSGRAGKTEVLAEKIKTLSGVERVAKQWFPPMGMSYMLTKMTYYGKKEMELDVSAKVGDENFIPLYGIRLLAGRNFQQSDSLRELVINATFAKRLGFQKPAEALNQFLDFNGKKYPIVGVVDDFHEQSFHSKIDPTFIGNMPQARNLGVKLSGQSVDEVKTTLARIEEQWKAVHPDKKFEYDFLDERIASLYEKEQKTSRLVKIATAVAILVSCMGLFGLATFTAEQRTKEISIRKVLGASVAGIVALLSKDFLKLVFVALLLAAPIAWWAMTEWLKDFAYKVAIEWWVFALAGGLAVLIALLTISFQSIRAALANPVKSLRME
ncbi:ABC transporter permease [Larkinella bovis]|uniref:ABC transporter permease n=1 Tax=Larkinella bovis TaxID=683041 RepID=A0ABW0I5P4_9BACT